jgi:hypothetical protein
MAQKRALCHNSRVFANLLAQITGHPKEGDGGLISNQGDDAFTH